MRNLLTPLILLLVSSCAGSPPISWEEASTRNTVGAYREYLEENPRGVHRDEAAEARSNLVEQKKRRDREDRDYELTITVDNISDYKKFIAEYPDSQYVPDIEERLENLDLKLYERLRPESYRAAHPDGKYVQASWEKEAKQSWAYLQRKPVLQWANVSDFSRKYGHTSYGPLAKERLATFAIVDFNDGHVASLGDKAYRFTVFYEETNGVSFDLDSYLISGRIGEITFSTGDAIEISVSAEAFGRGQFSDTFRFGEFGYPNIPSLVEGTEIRISFRGKDANGNAVWADAIAVVSN